MVKKNREPEAAAEPSSEHANSDDSSTSSDEEVIPSTPRPLSLTDKKLAADQKKAASESEEESDSPPAPKSKPKAMDNGSKLKTQKWSPKPRPVVLAAKAQVKRAVPLEAEESKKKKAKKEEEEGKKSAVLFQRLWGDEDEIAVLKGMVDYKEEKGRDPMADLTDFYDFVKNSLDVDVDRKQVVDKIRRLKKRYVNSANKKTLTPHEEKAGEISKLIWGEKSADVEKKQTTKSNITVSKSKADSPVTDKVTDKGWQFIGKGCVKLGMDENVVSLGLSLCGNDIKSEIENKWKHLYLEEASFFARKLELACQETKLVTDALKSVAK